MSCLPRLLVLASESMTTADAGLVQRLGLQTAAEPPSDGFYLLRDAQGLALANADQPRVNPVRVDFVQGALAHRRQFGGGRGQAIAKACGLKPGVSPQVLDATLGLAGDAFVLAALGCEVLGIERHPWVAALVQDGLQRAIAVPELAWLEQHLQVVEGDAGRNMAALAGDFAPQVIYLDPMFPHTEKSAEVKKEMRFFRELIGPDADADLLLQQALQLASHRVVVKRPRKAPCLAGQSPNLCLEGKANRFDVYTLRKLEK
jgi:16S rRNA (guanine1516-N2)-methyltransferase